MHPVSYLLFNQIKWSTTMFNLFGKKEVKVSQADIAQARLEKRLKEMEHIRKIVAGGDIADRTAQAVSAQVKELLAK